MSEQWKDTNGSSATVYDSAVYTTIDLWQQAWSMAGKSLFYMQFLVHINWGEQQKRVEEMCYHLAVEHQSHFPDTSENRQWFRDWIEKFADEVENQC